MSVFHCRFSRSSQHTLQSARLEFRTRARTGMRWLNGTMNEPWLAGNRFTVADICLYSYIDQLCDVGQPIPEDLRRVNDWFRRVGERPGAEPSIWRERPMGMRG